MRCSVRRRMDAGHRVCEQRWRLKKCGTERIGSSRAIVVCSATVSRAQQPAAGLTTQADAEDLAKKLEAIS